MLYAEMDFVYGESECVICRKGFGVDANDKPVRVTEGRNRLMECCFKRGDNGLGVYLASNPAVVNVHEDCRREYHYIASQQLKRCASANDVSDDGEKVKFLRSSVESFQWKQNCFLCGKSAPIDRKHPNRSAVHLVQSDHIMQNMMSICDKRCNEWAFEVQGRLLTCGDLHARYHQRCHRNFSRLTSHNNTDSVSSKSINTGRSADTDMSAVFDVMCDKLENAEADCVQTVDELVKQMKALTGDDDRAYSGKYMKQKLMERYGDNLFFADVFGRKNVICFRNMAQRLINDKWYAERETDVADESRRIVEAAAKLTKASIRETEFDMDVYPLNGAIEDRVVAKGWVPSLLNTFLESLLCDEVKQIALGHSIVQASRPQSVISPVLFGVGVSVDHIVGSKGLLQKLARLGFSISPDEVNLYKQLVTKESNIDMSDSSSFTQWAADNADHNVATLDGLGTFHGMGIISMSVPNSVIGRAVSSGSFGDVPVKRL